MDSLDAFKGSYNERLVQRALESRTPVSGTFELLPACNMRCRMCYIQHTPRREELKPAEFWTELFERAIAEGLLYPLLTGGEPFLYPEIEPLYERIAVMPVHLCINTNATLLDRNRVAWLAKKPPRMINISLYGASDETYARLCGNPNGFTQVMRAFKLLNEYGIPFRVHSVMVPENAEDYTKIIEICNSIRAPLTMANYMFPSIRKDNGNAAAEDRFAPEALADSSLRYMKDHFKGKEQEYARQIALYCAAFNRPEIYSLHGNNGVACKGGRCTFWVDWRGRLSACGIHNQPAIDLSTMPFAQAWKQVVAQTDNVRISEKCKTCRYRCICLVCPAAAFCETGAMDGTPEYLCAFCEAYAKRLREEGRRIFGNA